MSGNGAGTGTEVIPLPPRQILQVRQRAPSACGGAVAGATTPTAAVLPIAAAPPRRAAAAIWGFALPGMGIRFRIFSFLPFYGFARRLVRRSSQSEGGSRSRIQAKRIRSGGAGGQKI